MHTQAMAKATELTRVSTGYVIWQVYEPAVKAELFSTAVGTDSGTVVIDPISLTDEAREWLGSIVAILVTNVNHARAAKEFAGAATTFVPPELSRDFPEARVLREGDCIHGLNAIAIEGAAPGEFAFHHPREGGTLVMGDALINFEPHGFTLLPAKYCVARKQMVRSLRRLLDLRFKRIFFAHGVPILTRARDRLATLLEES